MTEQESQARTLFFQTELSRTQIADILKVPRRTLHYWIRERGWANQKKSAAHMPALLAENCYHLIGRFQQQLLGEDRIMRPITFKEADTLHKLTLTVNKLKKGATTNESMELFGLFMEFVNKQSPDMAQKIMPFVDDYISMRSSNNITMFRPDHINELGLIPNIPEDPAEAKLDLEDIMAWSEGIGIPETEQRKPEPLPKNDMPANKATTSATATSGSTTNENDAELATPEQVAEFHRLVAEFTELHNRHLEKEEENARMKAALHGYPYTPPKQPLLQSRIVCHQKKEAE